jgi:hypothetical protein
MTDTFATLTPDFEKFTDGSRKMGLTAVDAYERSGLSVADFQGKVAKAAPVEWFTAALDAQADFTRTVVSAQASAARDLLK